MEAEKNGKTYIEMKKTLKKNHGVREEEKQKQLLMLGRREKKLPVLTKVDEEEEDDEATGNKLKLDVMAIRSTMRLISGNMPLSMQEHALCLTNSLLHSTSNCSPSPSLLARSLKKVLYLI